jgi:hypothetical protein
VLLWLAAGVAGIVIQARATEGFAVDDHIDAYRERLSGFRGTDSSSGQGEVSSVTNDEMGDLAAAESVQSDEMASQAPENVRDLDDEVSASGSEDEQPASNES